MEPEFFQSLGCGCLNKLGEATQPRYTDERGMTRCVQCGHPGERSRPRGSRTPSALFKREGLPEETEVHCKKLWPMYVSVALALVLQAGLKSLYGLRGQDGSQVMTAPPVSLSWVTALIRGVGRV